MSYTPWVDLPFFPEQGKILNFSRMDFEQKNCREYQVFHKLHAQAILTILPT